MAIKDKVLFKFFNKISKTNVIGSSSLISKLTFKTIKASLISKRLKWGERRFNEQI
jgi:hypothetical protein